MTPTWTLATAAVFAACLAGPAGAQKVPAAAKATTVILVHGAFAGSSSWNAVISDLVRDGYPVIAVANPLRGLQSDADYVAHVAKSVTGPVVLVGHSYGGEVITVAGRGQPNVKALVFVAGLAPDRGESAASLGELFPGGTLDQALAPPVAEVGGAIDLYVQQSKFWHQFAADLPEPEATQLAVTQRPVTQAALGEPSGAPAWKSTPSWFIYGSEDRNIPASLHAFMARRAAGREVVEIKDASHMVMMSHAGEVASLIERASAAE